MIRKLLLLGLILFLNKESLSLSDTLKSAQGSRSTSYCHYDTSIYTSISDSNDFDFVGLYSEEYCLQDNDGLKHLFKYLEGRDTIKGIYSNYPLQFLLPFKNVERIILSSEAEYQGAYILNDYLRCFENLERIILLNYDSVLFNLDTSLVMEKMKLISVFSNSFFDKKCRIPVKEFPDAMVCFPNLQGLDIQIKHDKAINRKLRRLIKLRYLNLAICDPETDSIPEAIYSLPDLEYLRMGYKVEVKISKKIASMQNLKKFECNFQLNDTNIRWIGQLPNLISLTIYNIRLSDYTKLSELTNINELIYFYEGDKSASEIKEEILPYLPGNVESFEVHRRRPCNWWCRTWNFLKWW